MDVDVFSASELPGVMRVLRTALEPERGTPAQAPGSAGRAYKRLGLLPEGTLGREYWKHMTEARFGFPGEPAGIAGSVAYHDIGHVLAEHETTPLAQVAGPGGVAARRVIDRRRSDAALRQRARPKKMRPGHPKTTSCAAAGGQFSARQASRGHKLCCMTKPPARPSIPPAAALPPAIAKAVCHIQAHLEERLPLADVAAVAELSVWRFCTVFRRHTGSSPHRYISALRVQRVQALMAQGVSAAVAASAAGFYDQSHLNRHFKHTLGMTAGQFMSRCRGEAIGAAA